MNLRISFYLRNATRWAEQKKNIYFANTFLSLSCEVILRVQQTRTHVFVVTVTLLCVHAPYLNKLVEKYSWHLLNSMQVVMVWLCDMATMLSLDQCRSPIAKKHLAVYLMKLPWIGQFTNTHCPSLSCKHCVCVAFLPGGPPFEVVRFSHPVQQQGGLRGDSLGLG